MKTKVWTFCAVAATLVASPMLAQDCEETVLAGPFEVVFQGANYDGDDTTFEYCITALDEPDVHGLSNWELSLNEECIFPDDLTGCSPEPCFYQEDDPNTGITGIKFDDLELEKGETECFSFSLAGDWTGNIGATTIGLKAAGDVFYADICGPICQNCESGIRVRQRDGAIILQAALQHKRPPVVVTNIHFRVLNAQRAVIHTWVDGPITFEMGTTYRFNGPMPGLPVLAPGRYRVEVSLNDMGGFKTRGVWFTVQ